MSTYYNAADSVATDLDHLQEFVDARPNDFGNEIHRCFINAHQVNEISIRCLKRLNAFVAIGVESYALFDTVGKRHSSVELTERAIGSLNQEEVPMALSFVLGLPGESDETMRSTSDYIRRLVNEFPMVHSIEMSPLTVTTGSAAYEDVMKLAGDRYRHRDLPYDTVELSDDYFEVCCKISRKETIHRIADLAERLMHMRTGLWIDVKGITPTERTQAFGRLPVGTEADTQFNSLAAKG